MPTISTLPLAPQRNQDAATFSARADALIAALATFVSECNAVAVDLNTKYLSATASAAAASISAANAAASAAASASGGNASAWVSGTNYTLGICVWSPTDFKTYRCKVAGVSITDPSSDTVNWTEPVSTLGQGGTTTTNNITLVYNSAGVQSVTPSGYGYSITLPAANTCRKGTTAFVIANAGNYDYGIKNSSGTMLGWVKPGKSAAVSLADNSSVDGVWSISNLEKVGITANYTNPTISGGGAITFQVVVLDTDRVMSIFGNSGNAYAVIFNRTTLAWGSPILIRTGTSLGVVAVKSATDQVLVVSASGTALEAVTLTTSGTTITVNSSTKGTATLAGAFQNFSQVVAVGSSFVVAYGRTTASAIRAISISGTTATIGSEAVLSSGTTDAGNLVVSGSVVMTISISSSVLFTKPFTVSGTTLTAGTEASTSASGNSGYKLVTLGTGRWAIFYSNATVTTGAVLSLTGTVASMSTVVVGSNTSSAAAVSGIEAIAISSNKVILFYNNFASNWYANTFTDTAGIASAGTELSGGIAAITGIAYVGITGNIATFAAHNSNTRAAVNLDVSGTTPTLNSVFIFPNGSSPSIGAISNLGTRSGRFVIAGGTLHTITADASTAYNVKCSSIGMAYTPVLNAPNLTANQASAIGRSDSESWIASPTGANVGISLTKIEAVA